MCRAAGKRAWLDESKGKRWIRPLGAISRRVLASYTFTPPIRMSMAFARLRRSERALTISRTTTTDTPTSPSSRRRLSAPFWRRRILPSGGGDRLWGSNVAAYEALSAPNSPLIPLLKRAFCPGRVSRRMSPSASALPQTLGRLYSGHVRALATVGLVDPPVNAVNPVGRPETTRRADAHRDATPGRAGLTVEWLHDDFGHS